MPTIYDEERTSCPSCESADVGSYNYEGEEYGMWACGECGFADYPDAFDRPKGFIDDDCSTCGKETVHSIAGIDNWGGVASFRCTICNLKNEYRITAPYEFKRIGKKG